MDWSLFFALLARDVAITYLAYGAALLVVALLVAWVEWKQERKLPLDLPRDVLLDTLLTTLLITPLLAANGVLKMLP